MTAGDHDPVLRQEFANLADEGGERKLGLSASQVFPAIFAAAAFIAIALPHPFHRRVGGSVGDVVDAFCPLGLLHLSLSARGRNEWLTPFRGAASKASAAFVRGPDFRGRPAR
jgi:hypothetical protein